MDLAPGVNKVRARQTSQRGARASRRLLGSFDARQRHVQTARQSNPPSTRQATRRRMNHDARPISLMTNDPDMAMVVWGFCYFQSARAPTELAGSVYGFSSGRAPATRPSGQND